LTQEDCALIQRRPLNTWSLLEVEVQVHMAQAVVARVVTKQHQVFQYQLEVL
jgi:hypothetical protein